MFVEVCLFIRSITCLLFVCVYMFVKGVSALCAYVSVCGGGVGGREKDGERESEIGNVNVCVCVFYVCVRLFERKR